MEHVDPWTTDGSSAILMFPRDFTVTRYFFPRPYFGAMVTITGPSIVSMLTVVFLVIVRDFSFMSFSNRLVVRGLNV